MKDLNTALGLGMATVEELLEIAKQFREAPIESTFATTRYIKHLFVTAFDAVYDEVALQRQIAELKLNELVNEQPT